MDKYQRQFPGPGRYLEVHGGVVGMVALTGFHCVSPAGKTAVVIRSRALQNAPAHSKASLLRNKQGACSAAGTGVLSSAWIMAGGVNIDKKKAGRINWGIFIMS
ncbi:hypothetical protein M5E88_09310 [Akkermansia muciniphila]|nr:hypothetical protein M5E88_09310 [Akkermansia muciniphila]